MKSLLAAPQGVAGCHSSSKASHKESPTAPEKKIYPDHSSHSPYDSNVSLQIFKVNKQNTLGHSLCFGAK